jgi:hypothetical protein
METVTEEATWAALCAKLAANSALGISGGVPSTEVVLAIAALLFDFSDMQQQHMQRDKAESMGDIRRPIHDAFETGKRRIGDARCASNKEERRRLIGAARRAFALARSREGPLQAAQAEVLVGACYFAVGRLANARWHWEQGYARLCTLEAQIVKKHPKVLQPLQPTKGWEDSLKTLDSSDGDGVGAWLSGLLPVLVAGTAIEIGRELYRDAHYYWGMVIRDSLEEVYQWMRPLADLLTAWGSTTEGLRPARQLVLPP